MMLLCGWLSVARAEAPDPYPQAARSYLLLFDGQILGQHAATTRLPAASLVKLLTALVLLESDWSNERWITVSAAAARAEPSHVGLRPDDQIRAGAALAAMLIHSANDACLTLVENAAPDWANFVMRMNARANALGMHDSHFVDPCGFDAPGQYTTATDLLKLAQAAHRQRLIATLAAADHATLTTRAGRQIAFTNTNQLLGRLPGTLGMKTGYTQQAGQCLIALVRRDEHEVWLVMLGARQRWWLAHGMIENAFANASLVH
ncbi:MAG: D-alanyl-D-alanine carboxypeptidase family protein [Steroidobacteraceae bacterium]